MLGVVGLGSLTAAAADESLKHVDGGSRAQRILRAVVPQEGEAGLIHGFRADGLGIADLHGMFGGAGVVAGGRQNEPSYARVLLRVAVELIAHGERIGWSELKVEAGAEVGACSWVGDAGRVGGRHSIDDGEYLRVDDRDFIDVAALHADEE